MHNFVYLAQRRSQEFSCEPNFGEGACPRPLPWLRQCSAPGRSDMRMLLAAVRVDAVDATLPRQHGREAEDRQTADAVRVLWRLSVS